MKKSHQLITGSAILIALLATGWAALAYNGAQKQVRLLERQVKQLQKEQIRLQQAPIAEPEATEAQPGLTPVPSTAPLNTQGPRLEVEPEILDLGTIKKADGKVTRTFQLKNTGESSLMIKYVLSSCGCTTANLKNQSLAPQATYDLPVTYDPNYFGPELELGAVKKWIAIFSNDPKNPLQKVYLNANVAP